MENLRGIISRHGGNRGGQGRPRTFHGTPVFHVDAGLVHRADDHVKRNGARADEHVREVRCVDGALGGDGVALDAGDLHEAADRVAGEASCHAPWQSRRHIPVLRWSVPSAHPWPPRPSSRPCRSRPGSRTPAPQIEALCRTRLPNSSPATPSASADSCGRAVLSISAAYT